MKKVIFLISLIYACKQAEQNSPPLKLSPEEGFYADSGWLSDSDTAEEEIDTEINTAPVNS